MNLTAYTTRRDCAAALAAAGINGAAAEALLAETAEDRHAWRVGQVRSRLLAAARAWTQPGLDDDEISTGGLLLAVRVLALLDVLGVGGRMGVGGDATTRIPPLADCGKGRKHATDGPAWSAAVAETCRQFGLVVTAHPDGELTAETGRFDGADYAGTILPLETAGPLLPWLRTLAREGLRRSCGLPPWHRVSGYAIELFGVAGDPASWGAVVNAIEAALADAQAAPVTEAAEELAEESYW